MWHIFNLSYLFSGFMSRGFYGKEGICEGRSTENDYAREEGLMKGRTEEKFEVARKLLVEGSAPEFVKKVTGLSLDEIEKLQQGK